MPKRSRTHHINTKSQAPLTHVFPSHPDLHIYCINLKERKEKRKWFKKQMDRKNINFEFYTATKHPTSPARGCLESHLAVIQKAIEKNQKYILIFEDDAKLIRPLAPIPLPPDNWRMLYLGGTVRDILNTPINTDNPSAQWIQMSCWTTHAYILNLTDPDFTKALLNATSYPSEIDRYYMENIHPKFHTYMISPMRAIQREGFSDIEGKEVNYSFMEKTLTGFQKPEHTIQDGNYRLKLQNIKMEDLPRISVITPTYNRRDLFYIALKNMTDTLYPRSKIDWIIVDDSDNPSQSIDDILPRSNNINHIRLTDKHYTVAEKRNIGANAAKTAIIVHMDDDDYYPPESFLARTKILLKYADMGCVGSSKYGIYDITTNTSSVATDGPLTLSEASMAYRKDFWLRQKFNPKTERGEQYDFLADRFDEVIDMPFTFNLFAITHKTNLTKEMRRVKKPTQDTQDTQDTQTQDKPKNFIDDWDIDSQIFFFELRERLRQKSKTQ